MYREKKRYGRKCVKKRELQEVQKNTCGKKVVRKEASTEGSMFGNKNVRKTL